MTGYSISQGMPVTVIATCVLETLSFQVVLFLCNYAMYPPRLSGHMVGILPVKDLKIAKVLELDDS